MSACCAAALLGASAAGKGPLLVVLAVLQAALIAGWFWRARLTRPALSAGAGMAFAAAIAADLTLVRVEEHSEIADLAGVLAALVGAAFVVQLVRRDGRAMLVTALSATVASGVLAIAGAVFLSVRAGRGGVDVVAIALAAAGVALLPVQPRVPWWAALPVGTAAGIGVGVAVAGQSSVVTVGAGCAVAAVAAVLALLTRASARDARASWIRVEPVSSTLPVLVVAPAILVVASIMVG